MTESAGESARESKSQMWSTRFAIIASSCAIACWLGYRLRSGDLFVELLTWHVAVEPLVHPVCKPGTGRKGRCFRLTRWGIELCLDLAVLAVADECDSKHKQ